MSENRALAQREPDSLAITETPDRLIALALEKGANPETLSKLMDLQERWEANQAHKAFVLAMTEFKIEAPAVLKKNDVVDFTSSRGGSHTNYRYANLGSIVQEITAVMGKHGLSASWSTEQKGKDVTVTCHITHAAGHRESVTLTGPVDESGNKNPIQAVGSTVTYLQRYTLLAALGLATGEDDDGRGGRQQAPPKGARQRQQATAAPDDGKTTDTESNVCPKCLPAGRAGILIPPKRPTPNGPVAVCSLRKVRKNEQTGKWEEVGECDYQKWPKKAGEGEEAEPPAASGGDPDEKEKAIAKIQELSEALGIKDGRELYTHLSLTKSLIHYSIPQLDDFAVKLTMELAERKAAGEFGDE